MMMLDTRKQKQQPTPSKKLRNNYSCGVNPTPNAIALAHLLDPDLRVTNWPTSARSLFYNTGRLSTTPICSTLSVGRKSEFWQIAIGSD
jgi:hypothetical protein